MADAEGIVFCLLTYAFLFLGEYTAVYELVPRWFSQTASTSTVTWLSAAYSSVFVLACLSHLRCMLSDPGYTPRLQRSYSRECKVCKQPKPDRTHHCSTCARCVHRMDHHCPWVNNCVGIRNQKFFMQFLFYVELFSVMVLFLISACAYWFMKTPRRKLGRPKPGIALLCIFTTLVAVAFFLFTAYMLYDQLNVIYLNQTEVEGLKRLKGTGNFRENLRHVLGHPLTWLNPVAPAQEPHYSERLLEVKYEEEGVMTVYFTVTSLILLVTFGCFVYVLVYAR